MSSTPDTVRAYDLDAVAYVEASPTMPDSVRADIEAFAERLGPGARVLEVGSGGGRDARLMEEPHWPEPWPAMRFEKRNAIAYRMALVAAGAFDAAIALTPKWDWDVCAGALIVEEAGGKVSDHHGGAWRFNQADPRQSSLVCSAPALHPLIVRRTAPIPLAPR